MVLHPPQVEPTGAKDLGPCPCCRNMTRRVWGVVHRGTATEAAYFIEWTVGGVMRHGAHVDLILGHWGADATAADRVAVSLAYRRTPTAPEFMVVDATERDVARSELVGRAMTRDQVIGSPLAQQAFAIIDAIWLSDPRIGELADAA